LPLVLFLGVADFFLEGRGFAALRLRAFFLAASFSRALLAPRLRRGLGEPPPRGMVAQLEREARNQASLAPGHFFF